MAYLRTKEGKKIQTTDGSRRSVNPLKSRTNRFRTNLNKDQEYRDRWEATFRGKDKE